LVRNALHFVKKASTKPKYKCTIYIYIKNIQEVIMLFDPTIAPGVSFANKRSTDEEVRKTYWDVLHLRNKSA